MKLLKHEINKKGSQSWLLCNDNSRASTFRSMFINEYGGSFVKNKNIWEWVDNEVKVEKELLPNVRTYIFADETDTIHTIQNLTEFAKQNNLSRQKLYDLMKGERKSHKGFRFVEKIEPENPA
jgi:hypothetical protein